MTVPCAVLFRIAKTKAERKPVPSYDFPAVDACILSGEKDPVIPDESTRLAALWVA